MTDRGAMGESKSRLYNIWCHMRARCGNPRNAAFKHYGGRGIKVCTQWNDSYLAFRAWALENGYRETLTNDRKDNDGGYDPSNCRWATYAQQNRNYRRNRPVFYKGQEWLVCDLAAAHSLPQDIVKNRIFRYGWDIADAITTPVKSKSIVPVWEQSGMSRTTYYRKRAAYSFRRVMG